MAGRAGEDEAAPLRHAASAGDYEEVSGGEPPASKSRSRLVWLLVFLAIVGAIVAVVIVATNGSDGDDLPLTSREQQFLSIPDGESVFEYVVRLSDKPCLAGTPGVAEVGQYIKDELLSFGFDASMISRPEYNVLLTYPNEISLEVTEPEASRYEAVLAEPALPEDPTSDHPDIVDPYLGFSGSGDITGNLVYVNYARPEDFDTLAANGIAVAGKIGICRYGEMHRGLKSFYAEENGMLGLIMYSDPDDDGINVGAVYPEGEWRPSFSSQRGSARYINLYSGDPTTPGVPSLLEDFPTVADRPYNETTAPAVPGIPLVPISYGDGEPFLTSIVNEGVPVEQLEEQPGDWQGGLNFSYWTGGADTAEVHMNVDMSYEYNNISNVLLTLPGSVEPDRYVIIGGHYDGWVFGAGDPHAGTAPMMEIARAFGQMWEDGWRPRRTIIIAFWDGEEHGLQGSSEYVEQYILELQEKTVAYLNVDGAAKGLYFDGRGTPNLSNLLRSVLRTVHDEDGVSVYDKWSERIGEDPPRPGPLGSGSDYSAFIQFAGISALDFTFRNGVVLDEGGENERVRTYQSGVYHSIYDSYTWIDKFSPRDSLKMVAQILGLLGLRLAEPEILPLDYSEYADRLGEEFDKLEGIWADDPALSQISLEDVRRELALFRNGAESIAREAQSQSLTDEQKASINDRLMYAERDFLIDRSQDEILYLRTEGWYKHVVYAPGFATGYEAVVLPGVTEASRDSNVSATIEQIGYVQRSLSRAAARFLDL